MALYFSAELTNTHSFRLFFGDSAHWAIESNQLKKIIVCIILIQNHFNFLKMLYWTKWCKTLFRCNREWKQKFCKKKRKKKEM